MARFERALLRSLDVYIMSEDAILGHETVETRLRLLQRQIRLRTSSAMSGPVAMVGLP